MGSMRLGLYKVRQIEPPDGSLAGPATAVYGYPAARMYRMFIATAVLAAPVIAIWTLAAGDGDYVLRLTMAEFLIAIGGRAFIPIFGQVAYGPDWVARSTWRGWKWVDLNTITSLRVRPGSWLSGVPTRWMKSEKQLELTDASGSRLRLMIITVQNDTLFEAIRQAVSSDDRPKLQDLHPDRWRGMRGYSD